MSANLRFGRILQYKQVSEGTSGNDPVRGEHPPRRNLYPTGQIRIGLPSFAESLDGRDFNVQKVQEIGAAKAELELERTRHQLAEEEQLRKNDRLRGLLGVLALLMALGLSVALYYRQR
ncbi:MAG: hypothetical protein R2788_20170 [Saprospiraceae bacterium]